MSIDAEMPLEHQQHSAGATEPEELDLESSPSDSDADPQYATWKEREWAALHCDLCGQRYHKTAGHCHGGRWGGCCISFDTNAGFDAHKVGDPEHGTHRCMTEAERLKAGWHQNNEGFWRSPADDKSAARFKARRDAGKVKWKKDDGEDDDDA